MSTLSEILVSIGLLAYLVLCIIWYRRERKLAKLLIELLCLTVLALVLHAIFAFPRNVFGFSGSPVAKGIGEKNIDWPIYLFAYFSVVLGMLGQGFYTRFNLNPAQRPPFDWGSFIAPLFVSPLIFSPLITTLGNNVGDIQGIFVVFITAFENGFFFKAFVEQKQITHSQSAPAI